MIFSLTGQFLPANFDYDFMFTSEVRSGIHFGNLVLIASYPFLVQYAVGDFECSR